MEWKTVKLGDIADVKGGKRLPKGVSLISQPNKHPYIRIRDIGASKYLELTQDYEYVDDVTQQSIKRYIVNTNDILLSIVGTIGLVGVVGETLNDANQTENCVKINNLHGIDRDYLYYYLVSSLGQQEIKLGTVGAVQAKLPLKNVQNISIPLPPLDTQRRIAAILSSLDDKIENNNRINANLEKQAQALFKSWFIDFEPWGGIMPEDWKEGTLESITDKIASGGTPKSMNKQFYIGNIKWFSTKELTDSFLIDSEKHISEDAYKNSATKMFPAGTVLMAIYAAPTVGRLGILLNEATFNQAAVGLIAKREIGKEYLYLLLKSERTKLNNLASGAAQQNLNVCIVKNYPIIVPHQSVSMDFQNIVKPLFDQIANNCLESARLAQLRDTLLPKLMKGEINI